MRDASPSCKRAPVCRGDNLALRMAVPPVPAVLPRGRDLVLQRCVIVSHQNVRRWCGKLGQQHTNGLRSPWPRPGNERASDLGS